MPEPDAELVPMAPRPMGLIRRPPADVILMPVMDVAVAKERLKQLQEFCAHYLKESYDGGADGGDYGIIPGAGKKKALYKSGSEKLCDVYGLADKFIIVSKIEDFECGLFDYVIECHLFRKTDELFLGSGMGSCSSYEAKYRWRKGQRLCPQCHEATIIQGKAEYGGGWICWRNKGGCGAKFNSDDPVITSQSVERIENPDIIDQKNTVLKMAKKRAKTDAVIAVTRSSGLFTQDLEEYAENDREIEPQPQPQSQETTSSQTAPKNETQKQKIARVKAEQAQKAKTAGVQSQPQSQPSSTPAVKGPVPTSADGTVQIVSITVRNGPMIVKDGQSVPSWGPLYVMGFNAKIRATNGALVTDATTFDQVLAGIADAARGNNLLVKPVVEPSAKVKGTYSLVKFED